MQQLTATVLLFDLQFHRRTTLLPVVSSASTQTMLCCELVPLQTITDLGCIKSFSGWLVTPSVTCQYRRLYNDRFVQELSARKQSARAWPCCSM